MNVNHTTMNTPCEFQIDWTNRKRDVPSFVAKPMNIHITLT